MGGITVPKAFPHPITVTVVPLGDVTACADVYLPAIMFGGLCSVRTPFSSKLNIDGGFDYKSYFDNTLLSSS